VLKEDLVVLFVEYFLKEGISLDTLADVEQLVREDAFQSLFVDVSEFCGVFRRSSSLLSLQMGDHKKSLKELSVIQAVLDVEGVLNDALNSIDIRQDLEHVYDLSGALGKVHDLHEVEKTLEGDHGVLRALVELLEGGGIVVKVL